MIAEMRRRTMGGGGGSEPTAKSYIQDGLVVMYDGIDNAGIGLHDPSATSWTDIKSGYNLNWTGNENAVGITFYDTYLYLPAVNAGALLIANTPFPASTSDRTVEIVAKYAWITTSNYLTLQDNIIVTPSAFVSARGYSRTVLGDGVTARWYIGNQFYRAQALSQPNISADWFTGSAILSEQTNSSYKFYINGNITKTSTQKISSATSTSANAINLYRAPYTNAYIRCVRVYNKKLSESEMIHNYQIDRMRFNM